MMTQQDLLKKRQNIEQLRHGMSLSNTQKLQLNESIESSWQRSVQAAIPENRSAAPLVSLAQQKSALHHALQHFAADLKHIA